MIQGIKIMSSKTFTIAVAILLSLSSILTVNADVIEVPQNAFTGSFGPRNPYSGQTLTGISGSAEQLTVYMTGASDPPGIDFRILLTGIDTVAGLHPTNIFFESNILHVPQDNTRKVYPFAVDLGGIPLNSNQTYGILFECSELGGINDVIHSEIGIDYFGSYQNGVYLDPGSSPLPPGSTRDDYFAGSWDSSNSKDMAFKLEFSPLPSSGIAVPWMQIILFPN